MNAKERRSLSLAAAKAAKAHQEAIGRLPHGDEREAALARAVRSYEAWDGALRAGFRGDATLSATYRAEADALDRGVV